MSRAVFIAAENCSQPSAATRLNVKNCTPIEARSAACNFVDATSAAVACRNRRRSITRVSLTLRRLFGRLAAIRIGRVAEVLHCVRLRRRLVIREGVRVRLLEDLRIFPGECESQLLAAVQEIDALYQLCLRPADAAAWDE